MIIIIGAADEEHSAFICDKLQKRGAETEYLDTRCFPQESCIAFSPSQQEDQSGFFRTSASGKKIYFNQIQSVYWRYFMGVHVPGDITDDFLREIAHRESESLIGSFFRAMPNTLWVNSVEAVEMHRYKGYQLSLLSKAGLRVPETLMTNDPEALVDFYKRMNGQVIFKPVRGGAHTEKLKDEDLKPERLKELAKAPVQFQEFVPGVDTRAYLIGDDIFAAEIRAKSLDFRDDPGAEIAPGELPDNILTDCRTLAKELKLVFTGIDIRKTPDGEYVFIEGNPAPMFIYFERQSKFPISDRLCDLLMR